MDSRREILKKFGVRIPNAEYIEIGVVKLYEANKISKEQKERILDYVMEDFERDRSPGLFRS